MKSFAHQLELCESLIRAGQTSAAAALLSELEPLKLPRRVRRPFANFARRTGLVTLGLEIMWPIVHPDVRGEATGEELAEYAVLLLRSGANGEALTLLQDTKLVHPDRVPETHLYQAFCYFNTWEYPRAVEKLEAYVRCELPAYARLVGRVNLASAYVTLNDREQAFASLAEILDEARTNSSSRLMANAHEMRAQLFVRSREWRKAREELDFAAEHFKGTGQIDAFFIRKWRAIVTGLETKDASTLMLIRDEALRAGDTESVRESDLYLLLINYDLDLHRRLVFGTPSSFYRARVGQLVERSLDESKFELGTSGPRLDLASGKIGDRAILNAGKKTHQLVDLLTRDFYRPLSLGALHSGLFPGEHFDPFSSPDRVHQALRRARRWIEKEKLPLSIVEEARAYRLVIDGPLRIRVELERRSVDSASIKLIDLESRLAPLGTQNQFTWQDAKAALALPETSFKRFMKAALEQNRIERVVGSEKGVYRFPIKRAS